jgi:type III secretion protein V
LRFLGIEGHAAADPISSSPANIIDTSFRPAVRDRFATWDPMEYLVSCFKSELLEHNACFVDLKLVRSYLDQLSSVAPALVSVVRNRIPGGRLTSALRALAAEGISIRNMKLILESALLEDDDAFAVRAQDESRLDADSNLAAVIRMGLRRYLSYKFANGRPSLPVYILDPSLEEALIACQEGRKTLSEVEREAVLDSVRALVGNEPLLAGPVAILTRVAARGTLRQALVPEFAWLPVLADRELVSELRVQPLGRIALEAAEHRPAGYSTTYSKAG